MIDFFHKRCPFSSSTLTLVVLGLLGTESALAALSLHRPLRPLTIGVGSVSLVLSSSVDGVPARLVFSSLTASMGISASERLEKKEKKEKPLKMMIYLALAITHGSR